MKTLRLKKAIKIKEQINLTAIAKYALFFVAFTVFSHATLFDGFSPFALGLFVGLTYARQNILVLTPLYLLSALTVEVSVYVLVYTLVPAAVLIICYYACYKLSQKVNLLILSICALVGTIPYIAIRCIIFGTYFEAIFTAALAVGFSFISEIACYAVCLRGLNYHLSIDERICLTLLLAVTSLGLYKMPLLGFNFFYLFATFSSMFFILYFSKDVALIVGIALGSGAYLGGGEFGVASLVAIWTAIALPFKDISKFATAAAILIVNTLIELYVYRVAIDYLEIVAVALGLIIFLCIPNKYLSSFAQKMGGLSQKVASRNVVNQNRKEMSDKLKDVSHIYYGMQNMLTQTNNAYIEVNPWSIADSVVNGFCGTCPSRNSCFKTMNLPKELLPMVEASMSKGKITILDTPSQISSNCNRLSALTTQVQTNCAKAKNKLQNLGSVNESKLLLAEQFGSIALMLNSLSSNMKKRVSYSLGRENKIIAELSRHNIIADEAIVYGEGQNLNVSLVVRNEDASKAILEKVVSKALKQKMERTTFCSTKGEWKTLQLATSPFYSLAYGMATKSKNPNNKCGDTCGAVKLDNGKVLITLSDGMGNGFNANFTSSATVELIENFYKAGFESNIILPLMNKLLALRDTEDYSTVDVCIIDRHKGIMDIVKLGSAPTFILSDAGVEVIKSSALPIGILDKVNPTIKSLTLSERDMVVMLSDGVEETLGEEKISDFLLNDKAFNPQSLCERLLNYAVHEGANDDCSVISFRLSAI